MYKGNNKKRKIRVTPFGYLVIGVGFACLMVLVYVAFRGFGGASLTPTGHITGSGDPLGKNQDINSVEPSAVESIISAASAATNEPVMVTTAPRTTKAPTPTISIATPTIDVNAPTPSPSPALVSRTPTPEEEMGALDGKLSTSGVNLRAGPSTNDKILGTGYSKGTKLKVYALENGYYFVKIIAKNIYGFVACQFADCPGMTPVPVATVVPEGAVGGYVCGSSAMLRNGPGKEYSGIKELPQYTPVYVYFITDGWYYLQVAETGAMGYIRSDLVATETSVLSGTPVPN